MAKNHPSALLFEVPEIAAWQLEELVGGSRFRRVVLPALQRGLVWKPSQVEALWDSLLRGFPVGSFLLAPYRQERGAHAFAYQPRGMGERTTFPEYHLLDGQQRCNAIAVGFLDSWKTNRDPATAALWVDLEPPGTNDERRFVFRVVTRSHPWGYRRDHAAQRLEANQCRKALMAYREAWERSGSDEPNRVTAGKLPLSHVWPWDAKAPVPFPFLMDAIGTEGNRVWEILRGNLERLRYWKSSPRLEGRYGDYRALLEERLENPTEHMECIARGVNRIQGDDTRIPGVRIPALVLPKETVADGPEDRADGSERNDPLMTLFDRINRGGTPVDGEELNYSILKSIRPEAQELVESLSKGFMQPSRLVLFLSRLVLAENGISRNSAVLPVAPDVARFRRLIRGADSRYPDFRKEITELLQENEARKLFESAYKLLTAAPGTGDHGLPPVLATELPQRAPDTFFLFLAWLHRMLRAGKDPLSLTGEAQRRLLGAVTTLAWFSNKPGECVQTLWKRLNASTGDVSVFYSKGCLRDCLQLSSRGDIQLIPLIPPEVLQDTVDKSLTQTYGFHPPKDELWEHWNWSDNFSGTFHKKIKLEGWYSNHLAFWEKRNDLDGKHDHLEGWRKLADALRTKQELVLYAQRPYLLQWYPNHDPSSRDQSEGTNRPWDMERIHPQEYVYYVRSVPALIREWHGSIGNLRAWPLELRRGDGAEALRGKLSGVGGECGKLCADYGMHTAAEIRKAGFIDEMHWPYWKESIPDSDTFPNTYLADANRYRVCRAKLVTAIAYRWVALYRHWYDTLSIGDLF